MVVGIAASTVVVKEVSVPAIHINDRGYDSKYVCTPVKDILQVLYTS